MQKKLNIINVVTLLTYLWVIATLPLHSHLSSTDQDHHEDCTHTQHHEQDHQHADDENCTICINIYTPSAINDILFVETSAIELEYFPCYAVDKALIGYDNYIAQTANKDPPLSIIS